MRAQHYCNRIIALLLAIATMAASGWTSADPPRRVARLAYIDGSVSFSPAGENDWVRARVNWPLTTGDRLWTDRGARAELQVGGTVIRMGESTSVMLLNLDNNVAQVQLEQGTLNVRVRQLGPRQSVEVATPNLAFTTRRAGTYRIEADPADDTTAIVVRSGQGEVYGERAAYAVDSQQSYRFAGTGLRNYEYVRPPRVDEFERWAGARDRRAENSPSARYVSRDMIGYEDLDAHGSWRNEAGYGNVWVPNRVSSGWTPYRDGHWAWVDPWGWTWVDDAPWGFAPSHYGRWANLRGTWAWVPGPSRSPAVYAPALVAFVGGLQLAISGGNVGGVGWFPLGPRDVYRPSYPVSRGYFDSVNRSNTTINNTTITNVYNNTNVTNVYTNRQVQGAVVAVPATAFVQSQPVSRAAVQVPRETVTSAPVSAVAAVAPIQQSVRGAAPAAAQPPARARGERRVVVRSAPPAARAGFAAQQKELAAKPGTPLATSASAALKPAAPVPAPNVVVVAPPQAAPPTARPPAKAPDGKPDAARERPDDRKTPIAPAVTEAPVATPQVSPVTPPQATPPQAGPAQPAPAAPAKPAPASPQAAPPAPAAQPPQGREKGGKGEQQRAREQGRKSDQGSKGDRREKPAATPPAPAQGAPTPQAAPPVLAKPEPVPAKPAPAAAPAKSEPTPAPAKPEPTPALAKPEPASPQAAPPAPAAQPPQGREKGGKGEQERERERGRKSDQGSKGDRREKPAAIPPAPAQGAPTPQAEPPAPAKPEPVPAKPAPAPAAKKAEPTLPAAAPQSPQPKPQPDAVPSAPKPKPDAGKREDRKKGDKKKSDEQLKREEEDKKKQ